MESKRPDAPEARELRRSLLQAAARLFADQGYSATGVQQITDAAGANKAMLYYYFGSKEGLYDALIHDGLAGMEAAIEAAEAPDAPLADRLHAFLTTYLTLVAERPELGRIIYRELLGAGERARTVIAEQYASNIRRLTAVLTEAQAGGTLRAVDPTLAAYDLFGMANMFISSFFVTNRPLEVPVLATHIVDLFLRGAAA